MNPFPTQKKRHLQIELGKYLGTTSFDNTWRLWDTETGEELLYQQASCGLDALARLWDLRSRRSILALEASKGILSGHESKVTPVDVAADGQSIATVSYDRTIELWSTKNVERDNDIANSKPNEEKQEQQEKEVNLLVKVYIARPRRLVFTVVTFVLIAISADCLSLGEGRISNAGLPLCPQITGIPTLHQVPMQL
ncbi:U4/U6 small nuclear ribonucleoprotein PRP4-like protein [Artemisia annua]|uniref:U4/U6 small nuclear ribonucleoprotein PRP4-like protein n=1 Tax=Artemisia annua TaxID=35608 RepID=A0A2U1LNP4_ARTAN|nr:U4/U6 small nuclear ribonucleoprotein PRP4-like protein [Artemisia annua]